MQVTTRLRSDYLSLTIEEKDFIGQPLRKLSELRLHKIFILNESLIVGSITEVSSVYMNTVIEELLKLINLSRK